MASGSPFYLPKQMQYFMDPLKVVKYYTGYKLNSNRSKLDSYALGAIWLYINNGENLNGAHDSLVDAKAKSDVILHPHFVPYINT